MRVTVAASGPVAADHPKYAEMIVAAIAALNDAKGSSRQAIHKYISNNYKINDKAAKINSNVKTALVRGVANGSLKQMTGNGACGKFKLSKLSEKKVAKKPAAKAKEAAKRLVAKAKKAVKPTAKKPTKVAVKPAKVAVKAAKVAENVAVKPAAVKVVKPKKKKTPKALMKQLNGFYLGLSIVDQYKISVMNAEEAAETPTDAAQPPAVTPQNNFMMFMGLMPC